MARISRQQLFMEIAGVVAKRSTCLRLNVGAVLVSPQQRIISIGYNGQPEGQPHCASPCAAGGCHTIHAEINALRLAPPTDYCHLYVTDSPCESCAQHILSNGRVSAVYFQTPYRVRDGYQKLVDAGLLVVRVLPSGAMIDMRTNSVIQA
jgi:dCMP deaminase